VSAGNLSQTFDTPATATYHVTFQYVIQQGIEFEDLLAEALNGSTVLASNAIRFNNQGWLTATLDFAATGPTTTLRFSDTTGAVDPGTGFGTNWALDAVTVTQTGGPTPGPTATPEPATFGLAAAAVCVCLLKRRSDAGKARLAQSSTSA
jgi:hypothetical protein